MPNDQTGVDLDGLVALTPEAISAWVNYEPAGQFSESMSFARFNGMLKHAFCSGYLTQLADSAKREGELEALLKRGACDMSADSRDAWKRQVRTAFAAMSARSPKD